MSQRRGVTIIAVLSILLTALVIGAILLQNNTNAAGNTVAAQPSPSATATATPWIDVTGTVRAAFIPVHLVIPRIHVDAPVTPVGADATGAMDTPSCKTASDPLCSQAFWWSPGTLPGEQGNAVIAGHVNRPDGSAAIFGGLHSLVMSDKVQIQATQGKMLTFTVTHIEEVSAYAHGANDPTLGEIFGPANQPDLNLITCAGEWDGATFNHRLVIHTTLVGISPFPQP